MSRKKSNAKLEFIKDPKKSYVYIREGKKDIGMLAWHYEKKLWVFDRAKPIKKKTKR